MFQVTQYTNNIQFAVCTWSYHIVTHYNIYRFILYINTHIDIYICILMGSKGAGCGGVYSQSSIELNFEIDELKT